MTDKNDLQDIGEIEDLHEGQVIDTSITKEMKKAYLDYAMSVIVARALPDVRDGLKPVQRRIVYAASEMNLTSSSRYSKSAKLVGEVIGKYHPHGDQSIYDAAVRMAQEFSLRYPLIDGQGNWGTADGDSAAAMRYTECRLEKIADYLLKDLEKETVTFVDNYSVEYKEPTVLPAVMPNLLMNGAIGIAVGMATSIPPHNLSELIDGLQLVIKKSKVTEGEVETKSLKIFDLIDTGVQVKDWDIDNKVTLDEIYEVIKGPDFPTGCTIYDKNETLRYFGTGKGRIIQQAKAVIKEDKKGRFSIVITEIPYQVSRSSLVEKIANLVQTKRVRDISDIRDTSSGEDTEIIIELKREARPQKVLNSLYKYTPLQTAFNVNMLALVNGEPQVLGIKPYMDEFIRHRKVIITNRTIYLLRKAKEREHILEGLKKALDFIDEVIEIIKKSRDTETAKNNLIKRFELSEIQAIAILDMQLKRLAALEREKIENELKDIQKNIDKYNEILINPKEMIKIISGELKEIKEKFGDERKTKVIKGMIGEFNEEDLIANEQTLISITETGYIKRMKPSTYRTQGRGGKGVVGMKTKDEDEVSILRLADTHDRVLFLTDKGKVYQQKAWDIPEASRTSKGSAIVNLLEMSSEERLEEIITLDKEIEKLKDRRYILIATKNGQIKKTALSDYENIRKTGIIAIGLKENDELVRAKLTDGNNNVILVTAKGKSIKFKEADVRDMGRSASGVRGIKLKPDDYVVSMEIFPPESDSSRIFTMMENGYGKSTFVRDYTLQKRGGSGIIAAKVTKKTGDIVSVRLIDETTGDIIITSESGQVIRIPSTSIPTSSRSTQGVILMRLKPEDQVSAVSAIQTETEEEMEEETSKN